ncbi:hypothetical protein BOX15_Mlig019875g1 [Macrostomum lignano]|uniref:Uncharacterized protein n=2 Tax=Macrostomum lignano TaxID=282301 RepID=A0A267FAB5_9PLAT|nr:hypothetical protein BOX15_Mlig019875g2 [Macrostomum lignano]PAA70731.1 hypothetical protein BOX15_Mlig019875g1 [Macrostomum lignano]
MLDPLSGLYITIVGQRTVRCMPQSGSASSKPFTAYQLSIYRGSTFCHAVEKRYSDFERLHRQLRAASPRLARLPDLPSKRFLGGPDAAELRRDLDAYLNSLLACLQRPGRSSPGGGSVGLVCRFLGFEYRSPTHALLLDDQLKDSRAGQSQSMNSNKTSSQHAPVVQMPEVDLVPRAELDLLTYTVIDTVYQSSGSSSIDD